ncbi:hypothetical protein GGF32_007126 [Allomyces javanicus]|nr:hypothetical protein GGF32_007126 [Allomyces javanicus]
MDMIRAVQRQQRFSADMSLLLQLHGMHHMYHVHTKALAQYPNFLAMIAAKPDQALVPTKTIDLAWHTHQLFPSMYRMHTMAVVGSVINHDASDDVESEARITEGAKAMPEGKTADSRATVAVDLNVKAGCFCSIGGQCIYDAAAAGKTAEFRATVVVDLNDVKAGCFCSIGGKCIYDATAAPER